MIEINDNDIFKPQSIKFETIIFLDTTITLLTRLEKIFSMRQKVKKEENRHFENLYKHKMTQFLSDIDWLRLDGPLEESRPELSNILNESNALLRMPIEQFIRLALSQQQQQHTQQMSMRNEWIVFEPENSRVDEELLTLIKFWQQQFLEHVGYLQLLLAKLPPDALNLQHSPLISPLRENQPQLDSNDFEKFIPAAEIVTSFKQIATVLINQWKQFQNTLAQQRGVVVRVDVAELSHVSSMTFAFKYHLLSVQKSGLWIGSAWPSLILHMMEELLMFLMRLSGNLNVNQEIAFWDNVIADHLEFTASLADPAGKKQDRQKAEEIRHMAETGYYIVDSQEEEPSLSSDLLHDVQNFAVKASNQFNELVPHLLNQSIPNVGLPIDVLHNVREHQMAQYRLQLLRNQLQAHEENE